jgi:hypothetical protein
MLNDPRRIFYPGFIRPVRHRGTGLSRMDPEAAAAAAMALDKGVTQRRDGRQSF